MEKSEKVRIPNEDDNIILKPYYDEAIAYEPYGEKITLEDIFRYSKEHDYTIPQPVHRKINQTQEVEWRRQDKPPIASLTEQEKEELSRFREQLMKQQNQELEPPSKMASEYPMDQLRETFMKQLGETLDEEGKRRLESLDEMFPEQEIPKMEYPYRRHGR